jgi:hypothetical protein
VKVKELSALLSASAYLLLLSFFVCVALSTPHYY